MTSTSPARLPLLAHWRRLKPAALQGRLAHALLMPLLNKLRQRQRWDRLQRWLAPLLQRGISPGERSGSAVAVADWLHQHGRSALALQCLSWVDWTVVDGHAWLLRGVVEHQQGASLQALLSLTQALQEPAVRLQASYQMGELQRALGQQDQAAAWFLAVLQRDPEHRLSHQSLHYLRLSAPVRERVIEVYQQLARQQPQCALPLQLLAHHLSRHGQGEAALRAAQAAADLELGERSIWLHDADVASTPPEFLIIGVPRGGTTTLHQVLSHHPRLWCHPRKELQFFDQDEQFQLGPSWYAAQFPNFRPEAGFQRGETTPRYFQAPLAPQRIRELMPEVRCILLLRDPLQRALSWLRHLQRVEGLAADPERLLASEATAMDTAHTAGHHLDGRDVGSRAIQDSCYDDALRRWQQWIPAQQLLVLQSETLFHTPEASLARILAFLGVEAKAEVLLRQWQPHNSTNPDSLPALSTGLRQRLQTLFSQQSRCYQALKLKGNPL